MNARPVTYKMTALTTELLALVCYCSSSVGVGSDVGCGSSVGTIVGLGFLVLGGCMLSSLVCGCGLRMVYLTCGACVLL